MSADYIGRLVAAFDFIQEVWLFGSRANGFARADSDWDYLLFVNDERAPAVLAQAPGFNEPGIDLFVVNGTKAVKPWPESNNTHKSLFLDSTPGGLGWTPLKRGEAGYWGWIKRPDHPKDAPLIESARARLVYQRPASWKSSSQAASA